MEQSHEKNDKFSHFYQCKHNLPHVKLYPQIYAFIVILFRILQVFLDIGYNHVKYMYFCIYSVITV